MGGADAIYHKERISRTQGLPQGAAISPILANLYLDTLDEVLMKRGLKVVRYADDFVILCRSKPQAEHALDLTEAVLGRLELQLHREKTRITSFDAGFRFLGSLFVRSLIIPSKARGLDVISSPSEPPAPVVEPTGPETPVPERTDIEQTALGRAMLHALDQEGISLRTFVDALADPLRRLCARRSCRFCAVGGAGPFRSRAARA